MLMMETMIFADEVVASDALDGLPEAEELKVSEREVKMAQQLIESPGGLRAVALQGRVPREGARTDRGQGRGRRRSPAAPEAPTPTAGAGPAWPRSRRASPPSTSPSARLVQGVRERDRGVLITRGRAPARPIELQPLGHARELEHTLHAPARRAPARAGAPDPRAGRARARSCAGRWSPGTADRAGRARSYPRRSKPLQRRLQLADREACPARRAA